MELDNLIKQAKKQYEPGKYRSYKECFEGGVNKLSDLIRQQSDKDADEFQEKVSRMIKECDCNYCKKKK